MKFDTQGNPIAETDEDRAAIAAGTAKCKDGSAFTPPAPAVATVVAPAAPVVDADDVRKAEQLRIKLITEVGAKYGQSDLATKCVADNSSLAEFNAKLLDALPGAQKHTPETRSFEDVNIGLTDNISANGANPQLFLLRFSHSGLLYDNFVGAGGATDAY